MKNLIFLFLICSKCLTAQSKLYVKLYNKTEYTLKHLSFEGQALGTLLPNDSTTILSFDSLAFCGIAPCESPNATIGDSTKIGYYGYCGNGALWVKQGYYKLDIAATGDRKIEVVLYFTRHSRQGNSKK